MSLWFLCSDRSRRSVSSWERLLWQDLSLLKAKKIGNLLVMMQIPHKPESVSLLIPPLQWKCQIPCFSLLMLKNRAHIACMEKLFVAVMYLDYIFFISKELPYCNERWNRFIFWNNTAFSSTTTAQKLHFFIITQFSKSCPLVPLAGLLQ